MLVGEAARRGVCAVDCCLFGWQMPQFTHRSWRQYQCWQWNTEEEKKDAVSRNATVYQNDSSPSAAPILAAARRWRERALTRFKHRLRVAPCPASFRVQSPVRPSRVNGCMWGSPLSAPRVSSSLPSSPQTRHNCVHSEFRQNATIALQGAACLGRRENILRRVTHDVICITF